MPIRAIFYSATRVAKRLRQVYPNRGSRTWAVVGSTATFDQVGYRWGIVLLPGWLDLFEVMQCLGLSIFVDSQELANLLLGKPF
jgi:hypothetical protein